MNILVTGAAGFIGSNFVYHLLGTDPSARVVALDLLTYAGNLDNLSELTPEQRGRLTFVKGDINDRSLVGQLFAAQAFDGVVNFAAESHVDRSIHDPQVFLQTNVLGTQTLLDVCRTAWKDAAGWKDRRFVQISTDEVYGSAGAAGFFTEETPLDPHSPYSASKASADLMAKAYLDTYGLPVLISRCSNNYGPYQFPEKLIPLMILNMLQHKELPVYGDGRHVRDWLHVSDHCRAVDLILRRGRVGQVYNIGGNSERENLYLVKTLIATVRALAGDPAIDESLIRHIQDRPGHDRRYAIDAGKIRAELGWSPQVPFTEGLEATARWYLDHRAWIDKVVSGEYLAFYEKNYAGR